MIDTLYDCFKHWSKNGTVWVYSDPHFNDKDQHFIDPTYPDAETQIKLINSKVGKNDTLIILGDVGDIECVKKLRGYKVLLTGNHDSGKTNYEKEIIYCCFDKETTTAKEQILEKRKYNPGWIISEGHLDGWSGGVIIMNNNLFDEVYTGPLMISDKILLSHEPINIPGIFNIHGHVHSLKVKDKENELNVCSNHVNYTPINLNRLIKDGKFASASGVHRPVIDRAIKRCGRSL